MNIPNWNYVKCESLEDRNDVVALCELMGFSNYDESGTIYSFEIAPFIHVVAPNMKYQTCCNGFEPSNISSKDFIEKYLNQ